MQHDIVPKPKPALAEAPLSPQTRRRPRVHRKALMVDIVLTTILGLVAVGAVYLSGNLVFKTKTPEPSKQDTVSLIDTIKHQHIIDYEIGGKGADAQVAYTYLGAKVPDKLAPDEVIERRTENSYTRQLGTSKDSTGKPIYTYQTISYPQKAFVKETDGWYYREYAVVPKSVYDSALKENPLSFLFSTKRAYAAQLFAGAGDGYVSKTDGGDYSGNSTAFWNDHAAATGSVANATQINMTVDAYWQWYNLGKGDAFTDEVSRGFVPVDTSSIPAGATITAASLSLYATTTISDASADGYDYITILATTTQSSSATLALADFSKCGAATSTLEAINTGERKQLSAMTAGNYYTFNFNSTGMNAIKKSGQSSTCGGGTGVTCLGVRDLHDTAGVAPINADITALEDMAHFSTSESNGTSQDPYLTVTYGSNFAPWQFWDF